MTELLNIFLIFQIAEKYKTGWSREGAQWTKAPILFLDQILKPEEMRKLIFEATATAPTLLKAWICHC